VNDNCDVYTVVVTSPVSLSKSCTFLLEYVYMYALSSCMSLHTKQQKQVDVYNTNILKEKNRKCSISKLLFYLRYEGYVLPGVCLFVAVCLSVSDFM